MDDGIPSAARRLLVDRIDSVAQLEALLLLHALAAPFPTGPQGSSPESFGARDARSVADSLRIDPRSASDLLGQLARARLVVLHDGAQGSPPLYRFPAEDPRLRAAVDELRATYAERRVTVISLIFSGPPKPLKSFADAFRLRPEREDPPVA